MIIKLILELLVLIGALVMGARAGGIALGLWGAVGLLILVLLPVIYEVADKSGIRPERPMAIATSHYAGANLIWQLSKKLSVGLEGLYGFMEAQDGRTVATIGASKSAWSVLSLIELSWRDLRIRQKN